MNRTLALVLAVTPQFLLVAGVVVREELARETGQEVLLEVRAYDPMDALAGRYVSTPLAITRLQLSELAHDDGIGRQDGLDVWVVLAPGPKYWEPVAVRASEPELEPGQVRLRGTVERRGGALDEASTLFVEYPISRFYIPDEGQDPSAIWNTGGRRAELAVRAKVTSSGYATIEELLVDGRPYAEWNRAEPPTSAPAAGQALEIWSDTTLDPAQSYGALVVRASDVTIDGRGARILGATSGAPKTFTGDGISAVGVARVTLRNVAVKGFETGLHLKDCADWTVEGCDFSDNFHDPDFDWGENGRRGGIVLEGVRGSTLRNNRANRVWDACVLVGSNGNTLVGNDFSHASNTCLKLWNACENTVTGNDLSYGIRIKPGEVHARDSTCVLIESGSDRNTFAGNDCTHGGDGIFVRVLNGWVSRHNTFVGNDASWAHNNCIEAWSPENTWIRNKANHGSYGFWLGASDKNVLIDNEAAWNGLPDGNHNSPHLPDGCHAGIVFMFGPSSHTVLRGNDCHDNNGAGIAGIGDLESQGAAWRAFHWVIDGNTLAANRWGIYLQNADWIDVGPNAFEGNRDGDLFDAGNVTNLFRHAARAGLESPPRFELVAEERVRVGAPVRFVAVDARDAGGGELSFRWDLGDGTTATTAEVEHRFARPGFFRVGVTACNGALSSLAWRDVYAVEDLEELATEGHAAQWTWSDPDSSVHFSDDAEVAISGASAVHARAEPYGGGRLTLVWPRTRAAGVALDGQTTLVFWLKTRNENVPAWQDLNPLVALHQDERTSITLTPARDFLSAPPYNEAREGWTYFAIPLAGGDDWKREGGPLERANWITLGFDSWGAPPLDVWIDGLALK